MKTEIKLVGDVKSDIVDQETAIDFMLELEILMMKYKVDKVDVAWKKF